MLEEYVTSTAKTQWKHFRNGTRQDRDIGVMLGGIDEGPEAVDAIKPNNTSEPHFHQGAQFQVLVKGSIQFPRHKIEALTVHYTDHNVAYGPFECSPDCRFLVLHAKPAGQLAMNDRASFKLLNPGGRELIAPAADYAWRAVAEGVRERLLIEQQSGVRAVVREVMAGRPLPVMAAPFGQFEVVLEGIALDAGQEIVPYNVRFTRGNEAPMPLLAGPSGATVGTFVFDADAAESHGGSIPEFLGLKR